MCKKDKRFNDLLKKLEDTLTDVSENWTVNWEIEHELFTLTAYTILVDKTARQIITQNFHDGKGIFFYADTPGNTFEDLQLFLIESTHQPQP